MRDDWVSSETQHRCLADRWTGSTVFAVSDDSGDRPSARWDPERWQRPRRKGYAWQSGLSQESAPGMAAMQGLFSGPKGKTPKKRKKAAAPEGQRDARLPDYPQDSGDLPSWNRDYVEPPQGLVEFRTKIALRPELIETTILVQESRLPPHDIITSGTPLATEPSHAAHQSPND